MLLMRWCCWWRVEQLKPGHPVSLYYPGCCCPLLNLISANINAKRLKLCYTNRIYDTGQTKPGRSSSWRQGKVPPGQAFCGMNSNRQIKPKSKTENNKSYICRANKIKPNRLVRSSSSSGSSLANLEQKLLLAHLSMVVAGQHHCQHARGSPGRS